MKAMNLSRLLSSTAILYIPVLLTGLAHTAAAQQVSTLCRFIAGPKAGTVQDYAPRAPLLVGTPCQDGIASSGYIIPAPSGKSRIPASSDDSTWQTASINHDDLPSDPGPQRYPVDCWAASIGYIFAYYKHDVDQDVISKRYYPAGPHLGDPLRMAAALNTKWADSAGDSFTVKSAITDRYSGLGNQITNQNVVDALTKNHPVFFANTHHAMVLLKVKYRDTPSGPFISDGEVWDPDPKYHGPGKDGIRNISGTELQALFAAIPSID